MTSLRERLDRLPPLRTPERVAAWLSVATLVLVAAVAVPGSARPFAGGSASSPGPARTASPSTLPSPPAAGASTAPPTMGASTAPPAAGASTAPPAASSAIETQVPSPGPAGPAAPTASPAATVALVHLRSIIAAEERLAGLGSSLRRESRAARPDAGAIVALLRQVNATLVGASGAVSALSRSSATERLGGDLAAAHAAIGARVRTTLAQSLSDAAAYAAGAREVAALVDALAPLDAELRALRGGP